MNKCFDASENAKVANVLLPVISKPPVDPDSVYCNPPYVPPPPANVRTLVDVPVIITVAPLNVILPAPVNIVVAAVLVVVNELVPMLPPVVFCTAIDEPVIVKLLLVNDPDIFT